MKRMAKAFVLFVMIFIITGCGNYGSGHSSMSAGNSVDQEINGQMSLTAPKSSDVETEPAGLENGRGTEQLPETSEEAGTQAADGVDYDLTAMSSDMVYVMVYQMMADPDTYVGKTFRMDGLSYSIYDETTAQYYHYCIIQDALACCVQGMEFTCDDKNHISPDDYPEDNAEIVVQGVFETYQEEEERNLYCRLKGAVLEVVEN